MISTHDFCGKKMVLIWQNSEMQIKIARLPRTGSRLQQVAKIYKDFFNFLLSYLVYSQIWLNIFWMIASLATSPTFTLG
jgi:hypothetical protein